MLPAYLFVKHMKNLFKVGDSIVPKEFHNGIECATIMKIDGDTYYLKIPCGVAIFPIGAMVNYKVKTDE